MCYKDHKYGEGEMHMYLTTHLINIAALFCLIGLLYSHTGLQANRKRPFLAAMILTVMVIFAEVGTIYADYEHLNLRNLNMLSNVLGFSLTPLIPIVITLIFDKRILTTHRIWLIPSVLNLIAAVASPFWGLFFYIDATNQYMRGDYFYIFITVYVVNFLLLFICTLDTGKKYNYPIMWKLIILSLFTITGTSIQLINPHIYVAWYTVTLALFLYVLVMSEFDSSFDTLSGLYNRSTFNRAVKEMAKTKPLSVIVLDINDFKQVNDTYGHDYGDQVIHTVASVIRDSFSKHYKCYRYGGDEFSIISSEIDPNQIEKQLHVMADKLATFREEGKRLPTVSYGYSIFKGEEKLNFHKVLNEADEQMYAFKKKHKMHLVD